MSVWEVAQLVVGQGTEDEVFLKTDEFSPFLTGPPAVLHAIKVIAGT